MRKLAIAVASLGSLGSAWAQVTERVSVNSSGVQSDGGGELTTPPGAVVTAGGRYVAFHSGATNLVPGDTNGTWDVFVRDRLNGTTEHVSVDSTGTQSNGASGGYGFAITPDGRYVVFESQASNLVPGDTNGSRDIFLRDRLNGTTERVSVDPGGAQGNGHSYRPSVSADGRYVAFHSLSSNLVVGDSNGIQDVFVHDRVSAATELLSVSTLGVLGNGASQLPSMSPDGRYVVFDSAATNLVPLDTNAQQDVFVRDRQLSQTTRVSRSSLGVQGNGLSAWAAISADGRYVAFMSQATNLVAGDTNASDDVFIHDRQVFATERASVGPGGTQGNATSTEPSLSADGRYVAFKSVATNLIPNSPTSQHYRIFVRDLDGATNELASSATDGSDPNSGCSSPAISAHGRYVVFRSNSTDLVPGDTNGYTDVFLHDRTSAGFASFCDPGIDNVITCPCGNPPSGPGLGCDNSASSGGASLSASGIAYLSLDSLVFSTSGEMPTATSILVQGDAAIPAGLVFGQGVRCAGGTLVRLYVKTAVAGSITAPDFGAGDPSVSVVCSQLGVPLQPGEPRTYLVYYRDPIVLGGCPGASTFNATQTGSISWWP